MPSNFEQDIISGDGTKVKILANAVNGLKGALGGSYLGSIINDFNSELSSNIGLWSPSIINISVQNRYNQYLDYRIYMIPALMVILLILLCRLLPALNIVLEKESDTIEHMNVAPISKTTFIFAKLIPYWVIWLILLTICFVISWTVYNFVPQGSFIVIYAAAVLFILIINILVKYMCKNGVV